MSLFKSILNHKYAFWALLSLPAIPMLAGLNAGGSETVHNLLHPTGEFAARFMVIAMMISPLVMLFKNRKWPRWLLRRRRYLGVAAFLYAAAHTVLYLIDTGLIAFCFAELSNLYIWTGGSHFSSSFRSRSRLPMAGCAGSARNGRPCSALSMPLLFSR